MPKEVQTKNEGIKNAAFNVTRVNLLGGIFSNFVTSKYVIARSKIDKNRKL